MKKRLASMAIASTLLIGAVTGCAASKAEDKKEEQKQETTTIAERRGISVWAQRGTTDVLYEGKDIKDYYFSKESGRLTLTLNNGSQVVITNYHFKEEHPNEN
ncbi:gp47 [Bacillus phage W.Ph.]|uniref:Gp47 n=1 Tax=Bacillus phage W.Ph. TaxID=764595 RepID=G9B1E8_9CAUD|nr:gp47 [Bacillus phage W.Ph.]ADH03193.1 gp47 [Bacillus phage W.Ph.]